MGVRLESARSLKEELWFNLHRTAMGQSEVLSQALGGEGATMPPPGVALGIEPGSKRDDFKLAVRLQTLSHEARNFAAYAVGKAADEANVRYIGRAHYGRRRLRGVVPVDEIQSSLGVWKLGRTTGHTRGSVSAIEVDHVTVDYDGTFHTFDGQLEVTGRTRPFSKAGDSGALVVDEAHRGVGLLFAGSDRGGLLGIGVSYANPLQTVLDLLGVELHEAG